MKCFFECRWDAMSLKCKQFWLEFIFWGTCNYYNYQCLKLILLMSEVHVVLWYMTRNAKLSFSFYFYLIPFALFLIFIIWLFLLSICRSKKEKGQLLEWNKNARSYEIGPNSVYFPHKIFLRRKLIVLVSYISDKYVVFSQCFDNSASEHFSL